MCICECVYVCMCECMCLCVCTSVCVCDYVCARKYSVRVKQTFCNSDGLKYGVAQRGTVRCGTAYPISLKTTDTIEIMHKSYALCKCIQ